MKEFVEVIVVIPVGPDTNFGFLTDTIESYTFYTRSSYQIILADDSHQGIGHEIQKYYPEVDVVLTKKPLGGWAGLYINLASAFRYALENYRFRALLKLDTDALIIGLRPELEGLELFEKDPLIGIAGQYPLDYHGNPWDIAWPRDRVLNASTSWRYLRRPYANWFLRRLYRKALVNGYKAGESVFGGAYIINVNCLAALMKEGLLPDYRLESVNLGEDHLFALMIKSIGFKLGSLSSVGQSFALAWKGLPASPQQLLDEGRKIIHSTRYWESMKEEDIRAWFKEIRKQKHTREIKYNQRQTS